MTERHPADRPGHLDIDAVSEYVDRDFGPDDLATIEFHLHECPACHREVLEIKTTVMLLATLPQYAPRRSFCLGHEYARRVRRAARDGFAPVGPVWPAAPGAAAMPAAAGRYGGWLPGLQTVAVAVGAMFLVVTMGDMLGVPTATRQQLQLAAPTALAATAPIRDDAANLAAEEPPLPAAVAEADANLEAAAPPAEPAASFRAVQPESDGTTGADSASQEVLDTAAPAPASSATSSVVALLTPAAGAAQEKSTAAQASGADSAADAAETRESPLRLVQIVLALLLGWLVVTIVGLRRVRALS